jgi:hypothetical protein
MADVTHSKTTAYDDIFGRVRFDLSWSSSAAKLFPLPGLFLVNALITYEDNILTLIHELFTACFAQ